MRIGCSEACACLTSCCEVAMQALAVTLVKLNEVRKDPEALQKACVLGESLIQGFNFCCHTNYFPELVSVLDTAQSWDFYGFCRLPRYIFFRYKPDQMDEYLLLDRLEVILCHNWDLGFPDSEGKMRDPEVHQFGKEVLTSFLEDMVTFDYDLVTEEEVKSLLNRWLVQRLNASPLKGFDPYLIDLQALTIPLKQNSWLEVLGDIVFIAVDFACIPAYLQEWSLVDFAFVSRYIGSYPLLAWMVIPSLDDWIMKGMCLGYALQFLEAFRMLLFEQLNQEDRNDTRWILCASVAEFMYNLAILKQKNPRLIVFLAISAKSLGLLQFMLAPKTTFFN